MQLDVLDKGYVRLVDVMGSDLSVVNAARVSYDRESQELDDSDKRLINFLAKHGHTSPFRHATLSFEIYAPLMVARQWWKYVVGSSHQDNMVGWNESSRRYVTEEPEFYIPNCDEWRSAPDNSKQGSGGPLSPGTGSPFTHGLREVVEQGLTWYNRALDEGVAVEQARGFLPAYLMYVRWRWAASLQGVLHFLNQRLEHDAQKEIQEYAKAVDAITRDRFPVSSEAWRNA